jgi:hypothetical protein
VTSASSFRTSYNLTYIKSAVDKVSLNKGKGKFVPVLNKVPRREDVTRFLNQSSRSENILGEMKV